MRCAVSSLTNQSLYLDKIWTYAIHGRTHGNAAEWLVVVREQNLRWIFDAAQTITQHLEDANFERSTKTILDASQNAIYIVIVALELKNDIDNVLQNLRTCDCSLLGDVADDEYCRATALGIFEHGSCALSNLRYTARRRFYEVGVHRLYRVDDNDVGMQILNLCYDVF